MEEWSLSTNKIGICEWSLPLDGPYACKLVADLGFNGLQINVGDYHRGFSMSRPLVREAYLEMAEQSGIQFPSMAARVTDFFTMFRYKDEQESNIVRSGIAAAIGACRAMNIPTLLIPNFVKSEIAGEREFAEAVEVFRWACDEAGKHDITIAAENTLSGRDTKRFLGEIDRPNLKIYFDTQNYYLHKNYDTPRLLDELFDQVCEIHVKDGKGKDLSGALLGQGDTDFYGSIEVIKKHGYEGWIVIENYYDQKPLSDRDEDTAALIKADLKTLKAALE
jgi:sugar phosphate isomerase/epimerase